MCKLNRLKSKAKSISKFNQVPGFSCELQRLKVDTFLRDMLFLLIDSFLLKELNPHEIHEMIII